MIDEDKEFVVDPLSKIYSTMSQGVRFFDYSLHVNRKGQSRDVHDYRTYEISVLPEGIAAPANPLTYFSMEATQAMSIDTTIRQALGNLLGPDAVEKLEQSNAAIADKAAESGTKFKDLQSLMPDLITNEVETEAEAVTEEVVEDAAVETEEVQVESVPEAEELAEETPVAEAQLSLDADAFTKAINTHIDGRVGQLAVVLNHFVKQVEELQQSIDSANARIEATEKDLGSVKTYVAQPLASTKAWDSALFSMKGADIQEEAQAPVETEDTRRKSILDSVFTFGGDNAE